MISTHELGARMAAEMAEQPEVLRQLLSRREEIAADLTAIAPQPTRGILFLARGTSDNAALYGRYLVEPALGVPAGLLAPSLWTRYGSRPDLSDHLLLALSQSGRTPEIENVARLAREAGARTVAITNEADSPLALATDRVVALAAGEERAVPATKTFTAQLAALALVVAALGRDEAPALEDLDRVPALQEAALADTEPPRLLSSALAGARAIVTIGGGPLLALAEEAALKLAETTSFPVLSFSASDFLHGPLAVAGPAVPVICFAAAGPVHDDVAAAAGAAAERGAPVIWVAEESGPETSEWLPVPAGAPESLAPLVGAIRAQQLALELSRFLGRDPDSPAGLRKVTPTR